MTDELMLKTVQSIVDQWAEKTPDSLFFLSPETNRRVNYRQLRDSLRCCGGALVGVARGETIGVMVDNGWASVQLLLAVIYHGRRVMLINRAAGKASIAHAIADSGCQFIFADSASSQMLRNILSDISKQIVIRNIDADDGLTNDEEACTPSTMSAVSPDDDALLIYTSGTTGKPKGVVHTNASLLAGGRNTVLAHQLSEKDRALCVLPLYHINAQCVTVMAPLLSGGSVVVPHRFSVNNFWQWVAENDCTWFSVVPTIISYLLHHNEPPPLLPMLRFGRSASSALAVETHRQFEQRFGINLYETMGLSETAAQILSNPMPPQSIKYGSPGIAFGNEVAILDQQGIALPRLSEGEIAVRGENVMSRYLNAPKATAATLTQEGWFLTGDLGRMDADGFVFVTGRRKELIIKGGENIAPREIDDALYQASGVLEAAAFACDCATYGQRVEAAVVIAESATCSEAELIDLCIREVGKFKSPDRIHFLQSLPKGPSGKIQRLKLAQQLASGIA